MPETKKAARISDEAVRRRTGKGWAEWFAFLDKAGARAMKHAQIVALLGDTDIGGWWQQMVTVAYEQERGLRQVHQQADGYSAGVSRTFAVPLAKLYAAWNDEKARARWLGSETYTVRKATANKSLRISWDEGKSYVSVYFYPKGNGKSQVTVDHTRLASARAVTRMKALWSKALERLKEQLAD